jgi:hypothetical protein
MVVTLEGPCNKDLYGLARYFSILEPGGKTYHTKRKYGSKTEDNSISPANAQRGRNRHLRILQRILARR